MMFRGSVFIDSNTVVHSIRMWSFSPVLLVFLCAGGGEVFSFILLLFLLACSVLFCCIRALSTFLFKMLYKSKVKTI